MTQVNLLPTDIKVRRQVRRTTSLVAAAGVAVVAFLFFVFVLQTARLTSEQHSLEDQLALNARLNTQITKLARFEQLKQTLVARQALLAQVENGEVLWSGVLRDISMVIPDDMYLSSISGQLQTRAGVGTSASPAVGTIQFSGVAGSYPTVAKWLTRLEEVTGWVNSWFSSATKDDTGRVSFGSSVDLTAAATVQGAPR
jgi:Tfp pilus assembly protein PilN